jgi:hypothetical protein
MLNPVDGKARMSKQDLQSSLARIRGIQHACDLDLLLFFSRNPRALLTSEQIVDFLGYSREQVGKSLDGLIAAGHLTRSPNPAHAARLYVLELGGASGGTLTSLLKIAATREGRRDLLQLLQPPVANGAPSASRRRAVIARVA